MTNTVETKEQSQQAQFLADIPLSAAVRAYSGTSFSPERRGESARNEYAETMVEDYASLRELALKHGTEGMLDEEFERYRQGYRARYVAYLSSSSRCVSTMIAGPSNFPAARMNKMAESAHRKLEEFLEFRERALSAIRKKLCPSLRPIMSGDSDAVERLTAEIAKAEKDQEQMCAINAAHKRFLADPASLETTPFSDATKEAIRNYKPRYSWEPHPIPPFRLTNHSANIRRMKQRLAALSAVKAIPAVQAEGLNGIRFEDCPADNRVRLFFPGKPDEEVRARLKSGGFRWTPSLGCWQAYRKPWTIDIAKKEAGITEQFTRS